MEHYNSINNTTESYCSFFFEFSIVYTIDYRKLNSITIKEVYLIPRMDEFVYMLSEAKIFSTLDCNFGYWQIPIDEQDRDKTKFVSHQDLFRFACMPFRMPFRLTNSAGTFQRAIDIILSPVRWKFATVYFDDIIVFSKTIDKLIVHLKAVLVLLKDGGLTMKLRKCFFLQTRFEYLGHIVPRMPACRFENPPSRPIH